jgi:hypothetical protein
MPDEDGMVREEQKFISINSLSTPKRAGNGNVLSFQDCQQHHPSADFFLSAGGLVPATAVGASSLSPTMTANRWD